MLVPAHASISKIADQSGDYTTTYNQVIYFPANNPPVLLGNGHSFVATVDSLEVGSHILSLASCDNCQIMCNVLQFNGTTWEFIVACGSEIIYLPLTNVITGNSYPYINTAQFSKVIGDKKYSITFTRESQSVSIVVEAEESGGTEVIANPTLVGTEADLTGLQVGNTKYKVPSGGASTPSDYVINGVAAASLAGVNVDDPCFDAQYIFDLQSFVDYLERTVFGPEYEGDTSDHSPLVSDLIDFYQHDSSENVSYNPSIIQVIRLGSESSPADITGDSASWGHGSLPMSSFYDDGPFDIELQYDSCAPDGEITVTILGHMCDMTVNEETTILDVLHTIINNEASGTATADTTNPMSFTGRDRSSYADWLTFSILLSDPYSQSSLMSSAKVFPMSFTEYMGFFSEEEEENE